MLLHNALHRAGLVLAVLAFPLHAGAACSVADIKIKSMKWGFANSCRASDCSIMKGVAVLTNSCAEPVGVQLKIIGFDSADNPVATRDFWPASVRNIPPGDYTFSLDQHLDYDPSITSISIEPINVKPWR